MEFCWNTHMPICSAAFWLWQGWVGATETTWLSSQKYLVTGSLQKCLLSPVLAIRGRSRLNTLVVWCHPQLLRCSHHARRDCRGFLRRAEAPTLASVGGAHAGPSEMKHSWGRDWQTVVLGTVSEMHTCLLPIVSWNTILCLGLNNNTFCMILIAFTVIILITSWFSIFNKIVSACSLFSRNF